jgi:hypothetical protein
MPEISGNYNCRQAGVLIVAHQSTLAYSESEYIMLSALQHYIFGFENNFSGNPK